VSPDLTPIRFERRGCDRLLQTGSAMAAFFDDDGALSLTRVELLDFSPGGLGLRCPVDIEPGVRFCLYSNAMRLPHTTGIVARCEPDDEEFRVGLRCDARLAA
jgi:hypothetical protein